ncbi:hypothetical protein F5878DRAFT_612081 [Lentinula raphanica]|uniref:F-box domain-containing protein n=1 Tax=Lentinula raphanica TaxID=153919 RepID=A0AA38PDA4_9AGAR|nr:hypothetical protein F5878DRAFT_612081 [Lentinula raphanica]
MQNPQLSMQTIPAVNSLPVEILTEVFRSYCALQESPFDLTLGYYSSRELYTEMHIITTRTCHQWRNIVLSNPEFWTSFYLNLGRIRSIEQAEYIIETLFRFQNNTLRLHITFNSFNSTPSLPPSEALNTVQFTVLAHIWSLANRWRDVKLELDQQLFHGVISMLNLGIDRKPLGGYFPNLERLECELLRDSEDDDIRRDFNSPDRFLFRVFNPSPALHHLAVYDNLDVASFGYPQSLTSLELSRFEGSSLAPFLARLPNLQHLSLYQSILIQNGEYGYEHPGPWSESHPFYHPGITKLSLLTYEGYFEIFPPWADVRFPSLHTLAIDEVEEALDEESIQPILDLLTKSECKLQTLTLGKVPWEMFDDLVSVAPSLRNVKLGALHVSMTLLDAPNEFLAPLCGTAPTKVPCPDLSCLQVEIDAIVLKWPRRNRQRSIQPDPDSDADMEDDSDDGDDMVDDMGGPSSSTNNAGFEADPEDNTMGNMIPGDPQNPIGNMEDSDVLGGTVGNEPTFIEFIVARFRHLISSRPGRGPPLVRFVTEPLITPFPSDPNVDPIAQLPEYLMAVSNIDERKFGTVTVELRWN